MKKYLNHDGFTLVEMMFAVGLFSLLAVFMASGLVFMNSVSHKDSHSMETREWNIFIRQLDHELQHSEVINMYFPKVLAFQNVDGLVTYEKYQSLIRRRVNNAGHEVLLLNVKDFSLEQQLNQIKIIVTASNGEIYEKKLFLQSGLSIYQK